MKEEQMTPEQRADMVAYYFERGSCKHYKKQIKIMKKQLLLLIMMLLPLVVWADALNVEINGGHLQNPVLKI